MDSHTLMIIVGMILDNDIDNEIHVYTTFLLLNDVIFHIVRLPTYSDSSFLS